jgi:tetratricopeptide (TPR) repeat protein
MALSLSTESRVQRDLKRWMKVRHLTQKRLGRSLGLCRKTVGHILAKRGRLLQRHVDVALRELGLDPLEFYTAALTDFSAELLLDEILTSTARQQVRDFRRAVLERPPRKTYSAAALRSMCDGLETLRFEDPRRARRMALEILLTPDVDGALAAEAWGILGVLYRYRGMAAIAAFCLQNALAITGPGSAARARNLQRAAILLLAGANRPDLAFRAISTAREHYAVLGDLAGQGKTHVDEGFARFITGDYAAARAAYSAALPLLPGNLRISRFAAFQGIATAAVYLADYDEAKAFLHKAAEALPPKSAYLRTGIDWLLAEIELARDHYESAVEHFLAVWDAYIDLELGPLAVTLVSLRMAKVYSLAGDGHSLREILRELASLQPSLQGSHPELGLVLAEFLRESARGRITAELLEEIYRKLREGARNAPPLLPTGIPSG